MKIIKHTSGNVQIVGDNYNRFFPPNRGFGKSKDGQSLNIWNGGELEEQISYSNFTGYVIAGVETAMPAELDAFLVVLDASFFF